MERVMGLEPMMMSAWKADAVATEPHPHFNSFALTWSG